MERVWEATKRRQGLHSRSVAREARHTAENNGVGIMPREALPVGNCWDMHGPGRKDESNAGRMGAYPVREGGIRSTARPNPRPGDGVQGLSRYTP